MNKSKVQELREAKGLTQIQLAEKAGIAITSLRNFEQGGQPSNRIKRSVAFALGVNLATLGGLNVATWTGESKESQAEKEFNKGIEIIFNDLMQKADPVEKTIIDDNDNILGFQEILWLIKKYKIEFPKGIL